MFLDYKGEVSMPLGTSFEETQIILQYRSISSENQSELRNLINGISTKYRTKTKPVDLYISDYHYSRMFPSEEEANIIWSYRDLSRKGQLEIIEIFGLTEKLNSEPELRKKFPGMVESSFTNPKRSKKTTKNRIQSNNQYSSFKEKIFIDSTFIIALIDVDHIEHKQAKEMEFKYQNHMFVVTTDILYQASRYLSNFYKSEIINFIENIFTSRQYNVIQTTPELFNKSFAKYKNKGDIHTRNMNWTLAQCYSFITMENMGIDKVLTFDKEFILAGFYVLPDVFR